MENSPKKQNTYPWLFLVAAGAFFFIKLANIAPKLSDENTWFYAAKLLTEGVLPYRDFFQAHLPGQIALYAIPIKLFGFRLELLKLFPILFSLASAYLLFEIARFRISDIRYRILAPIIFLFSFTLLTTTDHATGVHEATFFLVLTWYFLERALENAKWKMANPALAGLSLFAGLVIRPYILPAALGFAAYLVWRKRFKETAVYLSSSLVPWAAANLAFWRAWGEDFLTPVWRYHFLKTEGIDKGRVFFFFLQNEWAILLLASAGLVLFLRRAPRNGLALAGLGAQLAFLFIFADVYYLYLVTLLPFIAYFAGLGLYAFSQKYSLHYSKFLATLAFVASLNFLNYQQNHAPTSVVTNLSEITEEVKRTAGPQDTIFGSFSLAPLIALQADLKITNNEFDTNAKRYLTGLLSSDEATRLATGSAIFVQTAVVEPSGKILALDPDFVKQYVVQDSCRLLHSWPIRRDYEKNAILLWTCNPH